MQPGCQCYGFVKRIIQMETLLLNSTVPLQWFPKVFSSENFRNGFVRQLVQSEEIFQTIPEMSRIQSRTPEKKAKKHVTLTDPNLVPLPTYLFFHLIPRS